MDAMGAVRRKENKMSEKKWVSRDYDTIGQYRSLHEIIEQPNEAVKDEKWRDLTIRLRNEYGDVFIIIEGKRLETDMEQKQREQMEEIMKKQGEEQERIQYEQLKKKFEPH